MNRSFPLLALCAGLGIAGAAAASTIIGNPIISVQLDSGSSAHIGLVRGYTCPGYVDVFVGETITTTTFAEFELPEKTWCAMDIDVTWPGHSTPDTLAVKGFSTFITVAGGPDRTITLLASPPTATLD
ncbi:MAG: hypothetical protein AAGA48_19455 [Myxococcota bacterium]